METGPTSHCPGNIEAACSLAHRQMNELDCSPDSKGALMIVAITNGNFVLRDGYQLIESLDYDIIVWLFCKIFFVL